MTPPADHTAAPDSATARLRLLAMTDLHGHLRGFDYHQGRPTPGIGLARLASLIATARAEADNCLLFDNGDTVQGTVLSDRALAHNEAAPETGQPNPIVAALNWLQVDAATIGNHEFNFGIPALLAAYETARFPVVCANVLTRRGRTPSDDDTLLPAWHMLTRQIIDRDGSHHSLRIGVTGALPPQIMNWDHSHLDGKVTVRGHHRGAAGPG